jgi:hypothetical protein
MAKKRNLRRIKKAIRNWDRITGTPKGSKQTWKRKLSPIRKAIKGLGSIDRDLKRVQANLQEFLKKAPPPSRWPIKTKRPAK